MRRRRAEPATAGPDSAPGQLLRHASDRIGLRLAYVAESNASAVRLALARRQNIVTIVDPWLPVTQPHAGLVIRRIEPKIVLRALMLTSPDRPLSRLATDFKWTFRKTLDEIIKKTGIIRPLNG